MNKTKEKKSPTYDKGETSTVVNTIGKTYVLNEEITNHALPITITRGGPILPNDSSKIC
jgi:hypothetical protein